MRRECALFIVEDQLHGLRGSLSVERMERKDRVSQSAVSSDEQSFVRHLGAAKSPIFENRQRLRTLIIPGDAHRTADGFHTSKLVPPASARFDGIRRPPNPPSWPPQGKEQK